ncbi:hypothetical protein Fmac_014394 [Flemingia macrophylla]|uniref:MYB transcription factor n=1 Tax=Flemingia macrophylla TaxID=520843 RepID=A0ABD1MBN0_9FABA
MAIQDENGLNISQSGPPSGNGVSLSPGEHSVAHIQLHDHDQFSCGNDYALKVRKPYTITKQRERWTDEEHKKFLEALKLHGRAWRRIEEHVGTKTAVQIRSHAQKFFSKVLRDPSGNSTKTVESIEIPPPRPKRKPMHPYPRKLVETSNKLILIPGELKKSSSLKSSDFDQENQSPKSVLSALGSDSLGSSDSDTPNGSLSPMSSISGVNTSSFVQAELKTTYEEAGRNADSTHNQKPLMLPPNESVSIKEDSSEESSSRSFKLFGMTLFVADTYKPPSPTIETCKPTTLNVGGRCSNEGNGKLELVGHSRPIETHGKGFVPNKRCLAGKENKSSYER